jgi:hypothetical protein
MNIEKLSFWFGGFLAVVGILCAICLIIGLPVWILWNLLMPTIFDLPYITFWQAVGLSLLCSFLFKTINVSSKK